MWWNGGVYDDNVGVEFVFVFAGNARAYERFTRWNALIYMMFAVDVVL